MNVLAALRHFASHFTVTLSNPEKLFDTAFLMVGAVIVLYIVSTVAHDAWTAIRARRKRP
jgi:hypothetical protein